MTQNITKPYQILSGSSLKMIAIITMLIDHIGHTLIYWNPDTQPYYTYFRQVGRLAFPIFCFLLIQGFLHTSDRRKYALSMLVFALISEIPFDMVITGNPFDTYSQNVFFTLLIGLCTIWAMEHFTHKPLLQAVCVLIGVSAALLMHTDYDYRGILLITVLYIFRYMPFVQAAAGWICLFWEWIAGFAFIPILMYNGKRGWMKGKVAKYIFYAFYPLHLILLAYIRHLMYPQFFPSFLW